MVRCGRRPLLLSTIDTSPATDSGSDRLPKRTFLRRFRGSDVREDTVRAQRDLRRSVSRRGGGPPRRPGHTDGRRRDREARRALGRGSRGQRRGRLPGRHAHAFPTRPGRAAIRPRSCRLAGSPERASWLREFGAPRSPQVRAIASARGRTRGPAPRSGAATRGSGRSACERRSVLGRAGRSRARGAGASQLPDRTRRGAARARSGGALRPTR
jgi:hypothetical protein